MTHNLDTDNYNSSYARRRWEGAQLAHGMNNLQANICLLAVTLCWSCEVVLLSILPEGISPFATTCTTSAIGATMLGICFARRIVAAFRSDGAKLARRIVLLSVLNASYNVLIEMGLEYFDVSTGAFTLSMVVVVLPVMLLAMRRGVRGRTWFSALLVLIGIGIATLPVYQTIHPMGFVTMLASCIIRALFVVKLSDYAREHDPVTLAAGISSVNAVVTFIPWCIVQPLTFAALPWSPSLIAVFVVYSYFIVGFATVMNAFAQRRATPSQATIIYATEIIFSIAWAKILPDHIVGFVDITPYVVAGCAFIMLGNVIEIIPMEKVKARLTDEETPAMELDAPASAHDETAQGLEISSSSTADLVTQILLKLAHPAARKVALFFILLVIYLVISLPFKVLGIIPGFTDVRPVNMLMPVYGIFFGIPGCLANAVGNLISDILSDSLRWSSIAGFVAGFVGPYLMYLFWTKLRKEPFHLRTGRAIGLFVVTVVICACVQSLMISPAVALFYPEVNTTLFAIAVVCNGTLFPIGFAIPFIIMIQEELGFEPLGPRATRASRSCERNGSR